MVHVLVRLTVADQAKWKPVFEEAGTFRKNFGSQGVHAFANADSPNDIFI